MSKTNLFILIFIAVIGYFFTYWVFSLKPFAPTAHDPVNPFMITDLSGKKHYSRDLKGKIIIMNFWATWCPPCVKEFPVLLELAEENQDRVILILLSSDFEDGPVRKFLQKKEHQPKSSNVIIARDTEDVTSQIFDTYKLPETLIIDKRQNIVKKLVGANWEKEDVQDIIDKLF